MCVCVWCGCDAHSFVIQMTYFINIKKISVYFLLRASNLFADKFTLDTTSYDLRGKEEEKKQFNRGTMESV